MRRGLTLIEVVFAAVLIALVASVVAGAAGLAARADTRTERRLGAHEVANRLMLQYLDDKNSLPSTAAPIEYGRHKYRFAVDVDPVRVTIPEPADRSRTTRQPRSSGPSLDRIKYIRIRVFQAEGEYDLAGEMLAEVTRLYDPLYLTRNPDSAENLMNTGAQELLNELRGTMPPPSRPPAGDGR